MKRTHILAGLILIAAILLAAQHTASAASQQVKHQMIAAVLLRQDTNEAQVTLSVVDLGPSKKYNPRIFRRGVIVADDSGRMIAVRGEAALINQGRTYQVFRFEDVHLDMPGRRVIRVTHISLLIFSGDDWQHPAESAVCSSPSLSIDTCLGLWKTTD